MKNSKFKIQNCLVAIAFGTISLGSHAQTASFPFMELKIPNYEKELVNKNAAFVENLGQLGVFGQPTVKAKDVLYYSSQPDFFDFVLRDRLSFVSAHQLDSLQVDFNVNRLDLLFYNTETDGYQMLQPDPYLQGSAKRHFYTGVSATGIENVRDYNELHFKNLYQGVDMSLSHNRVGLRVHFRVKRGYDPSTIKMELDGLTSVNFTAGNLNIGAYQSTYKFNKPLAYQIDASNNITMVPVSWAVDMNGRVYFNLGGYDTGRDLFLAVKQGNNPIVTKDAGDNWEWSSYIGENGISSMRNVTTDVDGNVIYTGVANDIEFLNSVGSIITQYSSGGDAYLLKLNLNIEPLWYTFYGGGIANAPGTEAEDVGMAVATGDNKDVHLTGYSQSTDLDMLAGSGYDITNDVSTVSGCLDCKEIFYARFNENGILQYSTYYGNIGLEIPYDIMVKNGIATIVGERNSSTPLIPKAGADNYSPSDGTGFIMQFDNSNQLIWFNSFDVKRVLSVTSNESLDIIIGGYLSASNSLPIPNPSSNPNFSTYNGGAFDGFVSVFNSSGILTHGSYYGGNCSDVITDIISNASGLIYGVGLTSSPDMTCTGSTDIPVLGNGLNQVPFGNFDHFYFKTNVPVLNTPINFSHSGYYGGDAAEFGQFTNLAITWSKPSIALFNDGSFAITGATNSNSIFNGTIQQGVKIPFPICQPNFWKVEAMKDTNTVISTLLANDAYISIFDKDAVLRYTTYFGHGYGSEGGTALATYQSGTTNRLYFGGNTQTYNTQSSTADEKLFVEVYEPSTLYNDYYREFGATVVPSIVPYNGWGAMLNVNGLYDAPCVLSVSESDELAEILIFPNPANHTIEWQGVENVRQINIYSTDGRLVKVFDSKDNNNKAFIGDLSQGQYLIEFTTENGVITKKFFRL